MNSLLRNLRVWLLAFLPLTMMGCASYGKIVNQPIKNDDPERRYALHSLRQSPRSNEISLILAFSGGGTRAAALAYGVLTALRDTTVMVSGQPRRLLDEIDVISAVSGGSFTAAYFGLYGDRIFEDFEKKFLRYDIEKQLIHGLFNPAFWFSNHGRTEMAVDYYQDLVFKGATFSDLQRAGGPLIVINATDLGSGVRFSFLQDYFDLLCSDLASFPVANAVAASSAVPVVFNPVVVRNHSGCRPKTQAWLEKARRTFAESPKMSYVVEGLASYALKERRPYVHLVDGGITDNLGLLAIHEVIEVAGGPKQFLDHFGGKPASRFVVISVNASTTPQYGMESTNEVPPVEDIVNAMTDIQLHRTNAATLELLQQSIDRWTAEVSTPDTPIKPYFIEIGFKKVTKPDKRRFFNQIPTNLSLNRHQVDNLIAIGRELVQENTEFQRFVKEIGSSPQASKP